MLNLQEYRERLIERYDGVSLAEVLGLTVEDIWDAFDLKCIENEELLAETGMTLNDAD